MKSYVFTHGEEHFSPEGAVSLTTSAHDHNLEVERQEIAHLQTAPDRVFLYVTESTIVKSCCRLAVKHGTGEAGCPICRTRLADMQKGPAITTWLGTHIATHVELGPVYKIPAFGGWPSSRQSVRCRINGVQYHGTYYKSSGNYCRLQKSKRQPTK